MPSYHEVLRYLCGLWLLIKGDTRGLTRFDISNRGVLQSFWAFVYTLPPMALSWIDYWPVGDGAGTDAAEPLAIFVGKMAIIEIASWLLPLAGLVAGVFVLGLRPLLRTLIVVWNWMTMAFSYVIYAVTFAMIVLSWSESDAAIEAGPLIFIFLMIVVFALAIGLTWRVLRVVIGGNPLIWVALIIATGAPAMLIKPLEASLGVYEP